MAPRDAVNLAVKAAATRAINERGEIGLQVVAYLKGELVADVSAGTADRRTGRPVDGDTLFNIFSVSKAIPATTIHIQADRGLLDYDAPIARYWPEWGCHGKESATVRDALTHLTGTPQVPDGITEDNIGDWDFVTDSIAKLYPMYTVGKVPAYQAAIYGWVLGEIVRRTDLQHRPYAQFIQEELCQPLQIEDLWVGAPDEIEPRIAKLVDSATGPLPPADSPLGMASPAHLALTPEIFENPKIRRACIAATGVICNARSEARFWAMLANGGALDGVRILSEACIDSACVPRAVDLPDPVMFNAVMPLTHGGYWRYDPAMALVAPATGRRTICSPGHGASLGWADPDTGLAVAFCHNHMVNPMTGAEHPAYEIANVLRESLGLN